MRLTRLALVVCASCIASVPASAAEIGIEADGGGLTPISAAGGMLWQTAPLHVRAPDGWIKDFELWTPPGTATERADGGWDFAFPSGTLTLWNQDVTHAQDDYPITAADMATTPGLIGVLPVLSFSFSLTPLHDSSVWGIWDPARPVRSQLAFIELVLGAGLLREDFAAALEISPHTVGGEGRWIMDDYLPNPTPNDCVYSDSSTDSSLHCAVNNNAAVRIMTQPVPEPATTLLLLSAVAVSALRRRS